MNLWELEYASLLPLAFADFYCETASPVSPILSHHYVAEWAPGPYHEHLIESNYTTCQLLALGKLLNPLQIKILP